MIRCVLLLLAGVASADGDWYRMEVTLRTTSDWTQAKLTNAARCCVDRQEVKTDTPVEVRQGPLAIWKRSYDATPTTLTASVYVQLPEKGDLEMVITRGNIGSTTVSVQGVGEYKNDRVTGGGQNPMKVSLPVDKVRALGPAKLEARRTREKRVLAFYYPWYGAQDGPSKRWVHWDPAHHNAATDTPKGGLYDSNDEKVIERQIEEAQQAGIGGFIASWWGQGTFEDKAIRVLLPIAERRGFVVSVYLEQAKDAAQLKDEVSYIAKGLAGSKAWLKEEGHPVIFVYGRLVGGLHAADFAAARGEALLVMDTFDRDVGCAGGGMHTYNPVFSDLDRLKETYETAGFVSRLHGLVFAATVVPGYDDTVIRHPGGKRARDDGRLYDAFWEAALAGEPDWVLITSWNEWHEGSEVEPSEEYGDLYLKRTAEWARRWKAR